jgi:hypothetical protein
MPLEIGNLRWTSEDDRRVREDISDRRAGRPWRGRTKERNPESALAPVPFAVVGDHVFPDDDPRDEDVPF